MNDRFRLHEFALWALEALQLRVESDGEVYTVHTPPDRPNLFNGAGCVRFTFQPADETGHAVPPQFGASLQRLHPGSPMFSWLVDALRERGELFHAIPVDAASDGEALRERLLTPYHLEGGQLELSQLTLDLRPVLWLIYQEQPDGAAASPGEVWERHLLDDGSLLDGSLVESLRLHDLRPWLETDGDGLQRTLDDQQIQRWLENADQQLLAARQQSPLPPREEGQSPQEVTPTQAAPEAFARDSGDRPHPDLIAATVIWCPWVAGEVTFSTATESQRLDFEGWAQLLSRGAWVPPPFCCPQSGVASYELSVTDAGEIAPQECIQSCAASGRRVRNEELETCAHSQQQVLPEFLRVCPIENQPILETLLVSCQACHQRVAPTQVQSGRCAACRSLVPLRKSDPRLARVLGRHPRLDPWRRWWIAETHSTYVLLAKGWTRQLLLVLDVESLDPCYLATGGRWGQLRELPESLQREFVD